MKSRKKRNRQRICLYSETCGDAIGLPDVDQSMRGQQHAHGREEALVKGPSNSYGGA